VRAGKAAMAPVESKVGVVVVMMDWSVCLLEKRLSSQLNMKTGR
jgi:hypothetical protein